MITNTTTKIIEVQSEIINLIKKQQEQITRLEEKVALLEERIAMYESNEETDDNPFAVEHIDNYDVTEVSYVRDENGNWTTTDVTYEKKTEVKRVVTIADIIATWKIDRACKALYINNVIANLYYLPITKLTKEHIWAIDTMREVMCNADAAHDFGDAVIEAIIELNTLLSEIEE